MKKDKKSKECSSRPCKCGAAGGSIYGLGVVGAAIYFISQSTGFWMGFLGVLKALVWPAFLVYHALKFLGV